MYTLHVGSWQELDIQEIIHHLHLFVFCATSTKHGLQHLKGGLLHVHSSCLCNRLWQSRGSSVPCKEEVVTDHSQGAVVFLGEVGVTVVPQVTYEEQSSKTCKKMLPILFLISISPIPSLKQVCCYTVKTDFLSNTWSATTFATYNFYYTWIKS